MLGPASGKFPSIAADAQGWVVTYHDQASGRVEVLRLDASGAPRATAQWFDAHGGADAFPTIYADARGDTWLVYRDNADLCGHLRNLTTGREVNLGVVHGTMPFAFGDGLVAWMSSGQFHVTAADLLNADQEHHWARDFGTAAGTGLSHIKLPELWTIDEVRTSVPGMGMPQQAGGVYVGEAETAQYGPHNLARLGTKEAVLWPGKDSFTPRIAAGHGRWAVVTWGAPHGVRLAILEKGDFVEPVVAPPPPVVVPPPPPPVPPKEPTVQIPDHFHIVKRVSDQHPSLLAENSRESMTNLLWRVADALYKHDANWGLLSKSAGENHTTIEGQRVAVDALAYGTSDEIVDIFGSAYDGPGKGSLTWHTDKRRASNVRVTPPSFFPGEQPQPKPQDPVPPVVESPRVEVNLEPLLAELRAIREGLAISYEVAAGNRTLLNELRRRIEELAIHEDEVAVAQTARFIEAAKTIRPRLF